MKPDGAVTPRARDLEAQLRAAGDPRQALALQRFFKTAPGEYGAGDVFAGLRVPQLRKWAGQWQALPPDEAIELLQSPLHEARLLALLILIRQYRRGDEAARERIFNDYLANTRHINNWDLVDASAEHIVGARLAAGGRERLQALAASEMLWERRIAIIATFHFIRRGEFADTLRIARQLLHDPEDLIHKAVGWMLREVGKRDQAAEEAFLRAHYRDMPRIMLRYAIEKFPEPLRRQYLKGEIPPPDAETEDYSASSAQRAS